MSDLQNRFSRRLEAEYERRAAGYRTQGLDPGTAHRVALEETKDLGRRALDEPCHKGLFPFPDDDPDAPAGTDVGPGGVRS
ncbi:MAG: hypothetical protein A2W26_04680 [Acidobacteria bacterium RBG_16_64_8]|nr:MAG: hypothetical protein A2W26_04680 [Acidobacteria bacterium RBG_16_64_8]